MRLKRKSEELPLINVIPMIDIMFFLLVFFMLSTMYLTDLRTVQVRLTSLPESNRIQDISFAITIDEQGDTFIGNSKIELPILQRYVEKEIQRRPAAVIILRTDGRSSYERFSAVLAALKNAGASQIGIASELGEERP